MSPSVLILAWPLFYLLGAAVIAFLLYLVIRKGVRDGMLDARQLDREEVAERRAREAWLAQQQHAAQGEPGPSAAPQDAGA